MLNIEMLGKPHSVIVANAAHSSVLEQVRYLWEGDKTDRCLKR